MRIRNSALSGPGSVLWLGQMQRLSMGDVDPVSQDRGPSIGVRPSIFQGHLGGLSAEWFPSASSWLALMDKSKDGDFSIGTPTFGEVRPSNKALHLTKVEANGLAPFAGERRCYLYSARQPIGMASFNPHGEAVVNRHGAPISCAPIQVSGPPRMASGSKGRRGLGRSVGSSTSVASPRATSDFRHSFWLGSRAGRELTRMRVVAPNKQTDNNALERTRSTPFAAGPRRSMRCYVVKTGRGML